MHEARVIPVDCGSSDLLTVVLEETGGLGVDIVVDCGGKNTFLCHFFISIYTISIKIKTFCIHFWLCVCVCAVHLQEDDKSEKTKFLPHKHEVISVLGVGGHWVTSHPDLQVTLSYTKRLHHKIITSSLLFYPK